MLLYADEDFFLPIVVELRRTGHDVITAQEDGMSGTSDPGIVARAAALGRAVLTHNRRDFERLHRQGHPHVGICSVSQGSDHATLAARIDAALAGQSPGPWCLRVNRPPP